MPEVSKNINPSKIDVSISEIDDGIYGYVGLMMSMELLSINS